MKIAFYSPYIPDTTIGGGEKHLFDMACALSGIHEVYILVSEAKKPADLASVKKQYEAFFDKDLSKLKFVFAPTGSKSSFIKKLLYTKKYDYLFYWTDGSLFFSLARINNLHLQIPFSTNKARLIERLKLRNWKVKNANSRFTQKAIEQNWLTKVPYVINPMVDLSELKSNRKKEKLILHVGRFFRQLHSKRQDILVKAFIDMIKQYPAETKGWKLVLAGAVEDESYLSEIKKAAAGHRIEIAANIERQKLIDLYKAASIYWHATGYGSDPDKQPEKAEHFGVTTAEAMAAGAVPVVINMGGQPEVLGASLKDNLWNDLNELTSLTLQYIKNPKLMAEAREKAKLEAARFSKDSFDAKVKQMIAETIAK